MAGNDGSPRALADRAAQLRAREPAAAVRLLAEAMSAEPSLWLSAGDDGWIDLADEVDTELALELRITRLSAYVDSDPATYGDELRELYVELLDLCMGDVDRTERVRALGVRIDELTRAGVLPRTFVRRGRSRK